MSISVQPNASDLGTRTLVGAALIVLALVNLWVGGVLFWMFASAVGVLMAREWAALAAASEHDVKLSMFAVSVPLAALSPWTVGPGFLAAGLIGGAAFFVAIVTRRSRLGWGMVYVAVPILTLVWLRERPDGLLLTGWALASVWATDIGAFFAGRSIGGPRLAPAISPNKTWAGLVGGVVAAGVLGAVLAARAGLPVALAAASPLLAVIAQLGDLYESWLKRQAGVKDSGTVLPGHGGLLDRLDGVVTAVPAAALLVLVEGL